MRLIVLLALVCQMAGGCINNDPQPLTNDTLELLARTRLHYASVTRIVKGPSNVIEIHDDGVASALIKSLVPISATEPADTSNNPEYIVHIQSGRNPISFEIRVCDNILCYCVGSTKYKGGNADAFQKIVAQLEAGGKS